MAGGKSRKTGQVSKKLIDKIKSGRTVKKQCGSKDAKKEGGLGLDK